MVNQYGARSGVAGAGVDADYILYVSAVNSTTCYSKAMAYASHCQLERDFDRFVVIFTVNTTDMPHDTDYPYPIRILAFF